MTPTMRRAGGLAGMLSAVGVLVAVKGAGHVAPHTTALARVPATATGPATPRVQSATLTGQVAQTPFGPVQVQVVIRGGRIVDVRALQTPSDRTYSQQLAAYAVPQLRGEVLAAQSAQIDVVSGATYTSEGYAQSLQSALDQMRA